ncbi:D-tyrosyl-tRNA(Tyr) deacylase [Caminicella sporogenes DSM 14501]|uniref:D-aminoacyl-tRNA deacylase n=1 Tax=Caminicella sporogenes DSM 14501 TaxID=1121266 RepID=A0A1M6M0S3_9FIRM|nr:D-aminoacyl-tRNA deacylase [Caminicella sporogenes]RKD28017.1 D-tyrosyl-tRNA(Tyr) deacylase [Caminicella sporogenes]WIF94375.1 D-aminoacyl-tRNA deacylase [Caminicella sporogenes]SHJ76976.1 D-tyrosyl-tRNA(Tyr) deacylase [Caminicella sporogenes DSM 14501]
MRAVVQRVNQANVTVNGEIKGSIDKGLMVLLGVEEGDNVKDVEYMVEKIVNLRIFEDENEKMNLSLLDIKGELLVVSQFTLLGDCRKGRRPNFMNAAKPDVANELYKLFVSKSREKGLKVETGVFQAHMVVNLSNDGPVTILVDSKKNF